MRYKGKYLNNPEVMAMVSASKKLKTADQFADALGWRSNANDLKVKNIKSVEYLNCLRTFNLCYEKITKSVMHGPKIINNKSEIPYSDLYECLLFAKQDLKEAFNRYTLVMTSIGELETPEEMADMSLIEMFDPIVLLEKYNQMLVKFEEIHEKHQKYPFDPEWRHEGKYKLYRDEFQPKTVKREINSNMEYYITKIQRGIHLGPNQEEMIEEYKDLALFMRLMSSEEVKSVYEKLKASIEGTPEGKAKTLRNLQMIFTLIISDKEFQRKESQKMESPNYAEIGRTKLDSQIPDTINESLNVFTEQVDKYNEEQKRLEEEARLMLSQEQEVSEDDTTLKKARVFGRLLIRLRSTLDDPVELSEDDIGPESPQEKPKSGLRRIWNGIIGRGKGK